MLNKLLCILFFLVLIQPVFAQDSLSYTWVKRGSYSIEPKDVWAVDELGNLYISQKNALNKYDSTGLLKFSQSIKSFGKMRQLIPINSMKLVYFSEEQQTLCYLDNTLTQTDDCLDLIDQNILNAKLLGKSARADMIWVFDNVNSRLVLLPLEHGQQMKQEISNIKGTLNMKEIEQIMENGSWLYILDDVGNFAVLDIYGSLQDFSKEPGLMEFEIHSNIAYWLFKDTLKIRDLRVMEVPLSELQLVLPMEDVYEFHFINKNFYFRTAKGVYKFTLQINK